MITGIKRPQYIIKGGTITGLRISAVDGTAFLDNCSDILRYADDKSIIRIYDSSGWYLEGWIKAVGSGETLDTNLFTNGDFSSGDLTGWTDANSAWQYNLGTALASGSSGYLTQSHAGKDLRLHKYSTDLATYTSGCAALKLFGVILVNNTTTPNTYSGYVTTPVSSAIANGWYSNSLRGSIDNHILQQVLTPSNTGLTIVSTQGGSTYNFTSKNPSFTYNAASYRYEIYSAQARKTYFIPGTETAAGQPFIKRFGGVPYAALNRGVF